MSVQVTKSLVNIDPERAVIVKNIPPGVGNETIQDFLEVICRNENEVELMHFHGSIKSCVVAQFQSPIEDIDKLKVNARKRHLCNRTVVVQELGSVDGILALDIDKKSLTSQDCLSLYFERSSVGGEEDCIVGCPTVHKGLHMAVIEIDNPTQVVPRILRHKPHRLNDHTFVVEPYFANFHDDVIQEMLELDNTSTSSEQSDDEDYSEPVTSNKNVHLKEEMSVSRRSEHNYEEIDDLFEKILSPPVVHNATKTFTKSGNLKILGSDQDEDRPSFQVEMENTAPVVKAKFSNPQRLDNFQQPLTGIVVDDVKPLTKKTTREMKLTKPKVILLRMTSFDKQHQKCKVNLFSDHGNTGIKVTGDEEEVKSVFDDLFHQLQNIVQRYKQLSVEEYSILQQRRRQSDNFIRKTLTNKIKAYVEFSDEDHSITASAFAGNEAKRALDEFCKLVGEKAVDYNEGCFHFLSGIEWKNLSYRLENQHGVKIKMNREQRKLFIYGFTEAIDSAHKEIKQAVHKHTSVSGKPVEVSGVKAKLFNYCLQKELQQLQASMRKQGGSLDYYYNKTSETFSINFKGNDTVVKETERKVEQMQRNAWEGPVDLKRITRKDQKVTAMSKGVLSSKGKDLLLGFSKDNNCVITVEKDQRLSSLSSKKDQMKSSPNLGAVGRSKTMPNFGYREKQISSGSEEEEGEMLPQRRTPRFSAAPTSAKINNTKITVKQGNIANEKAHMLVSMLKKSGDGYIETVVAKNFFKDGGPSIQQNLKIVYNSDKDVVMTTAGNLPCSYLCHMILHKFDDSGRVKHSIRQAFKEVYKLAASIRATSIAFPAIGTGRLLGYPEKYIAECMVSEAVLASSTYNFQQITFVIYDAAMIPCFAKRLQTEITGAVPKPLPRTQSDLNSQHHHRAPAAPKSEDTYRLVADIKLLATSKDQGERLRSTLSEKIKIWFLAEEKIAGESSTEKIKNLSPQNKKAIYQLSRGKPVEVDIDTDKGKIKLIGEKETVVEVSKEIYKILLKCEDVVKKRRHNHKRGTREFWVDLSDDPQGPVYWKSLQDKSLIHSAAEGLKKLLNWKGSAIHDVDQKTFQAVESLVKNTFDAKLVGQGKDAVGLQYSSIQVKKIQRIENGELYHDYAIKRQHFFRLLGDGQPPSKPIENLGIKTKGPIMSAQSIDKFLLTDMYSEINEHYFFHGTSGDKVDNIADKGLDPRHCGDKNMFGQGVYAAECFTKADQYADSPTSRHNRDRKVLLVRMILGNIHVANSAESFKIPPCKDCQKPKCTTSGHKPYDSVVGDGKWLFREFVVYEKQHCYPEYVITYDRL